MTTTLPLAFGMPGMFEWIIIGGIAVLLFGKRLPEVGKSLGKGIIEFKKGIKGIEDDIEVVDKTPEPARRIPADQVSVLPHASEAPAPRFDPYTGKPIQPAFDPYTGKPLTGTNQAAQ